MLTASVVVVVCSRLSLSVTLHGEPGGGFTRAGQAMTSCRLQSDYSSTVTLHVGPVEFRPVRATPCFITGPPTHSVGGQTSNGRWRLSSSVTLTYAT